MVYKSSICIIDSTGFYEATRGDIPLNETMTILVVAAFSAAYEIAPLYIGYAICLIKYDLGHQIRKTVFTLSCSSFILGNLANFVLRFMSLKEISLQTITIPIVMLLLPLITSLISIVIGCLTFDPILFDIKRLASDVRILHTRKRQIIAALEKLNIDISEADDIDKNDDFYYQSAIREVMAIQLRLKTYIYAHTTGITTK